MLKAYIILLINLYIFVVRIDCKNLETRARISAINDDEHVHIKVVVVPKVLRKHKLPYHTTRPHYAKRLPTQSIDIKRPQQQQQHYKHEDSKNIFSNHNEFEIPPPMAMLTTENEILSHIAATLPLADNYISQNHNIRTQRQRYPTMMQQPSPPLPLPLPVVAPLMGNSLYATTTPDAYSSTTLLDGNILSADDFLREVQQIYAQKYKVPNTLMMEPQMQALTKTTMPTPTTTYTTTPMSTSTSRKNQKKRKQTKNFEKNNKNNNFTNYLSKSLPLPVVQQQQQEELFAQFQHGFKPYSSIQEFSNYYNNNNNKFNLIDTPLGPNELITATDDIDGNTSSSSISSSSEYNADNNSDTVRTFNAPIQPEEYNAAYAIESNNYNNNQNHYNYRNKYYNNNNNNNNNADIDGYVNENDEENEGYEDFNPISYQDLYATYTATPTINHLLSSSSNTNTNSMPTKHIYKRQEQGQPLREQFVQLSSIAPIVSTGNIDTLRILQQQQQQQQNKHRMLPTTYKREITNGIGKQQRQPHNHNHHHHHHHHNRQQQRNQHKSLKNRYNVNRRRLILR